jgi:hypothetical protein
MNDQSPKRPRVAMLSNEDALRVLRAKWPEAMTAREIYFAARPPTSDLDRSVSGSAYAKKAIDALIELKLVVRDKEDSGRSARYRVRNMPSANVGLEGIEAREVAHGPETAPAFELYPEGAALLEAFVHAQYGTGDAPAADPLPDVPPSASSPARDDPDPIATILLGMARAPRAGSRIDIVKNQAAEGIAWARAAGWTDHRIAQEIVEASRLDARPEEIVHLVAAVPGRGSPTGRTTQAR